MPKRGEKATAKQAAIGRANLARGREKRAKAYAEAETNGRDTYQERWGKLLDGTLTVADLDNEEIAKMRVKNASGVFGGRPPRIPSHLAQQFRAESIKRTQDMVVQFAPQAMAKLMKLAEDGEVKDNDRIAVLKYVLDRALGRAPETVHIKSDDLWATLLGEALDIDREMADLEKET